MLPLIAEGLCLSVYVALSRWTLRLGNSGGVASSNPKKDLYGEASLTALWLRQSRNLLSVKSY